MLSLSTIQHLLIYSLSTYYTNIAYIKDYVDFSIFYGLYQITVQSLSKNFHWTAKTSYIIGPDSCTVVHCTYIIFLVYFQVQMEKRHP